MTAPAGDTPREPEQAERFIRRRPDQSPARPAARVVRKRARVRDEMQERVVRPKAATTAPPSTRVVRKPAAATPMPTTDRYGNPIPARGAAQEV